MSEDAAVEVNARRGRGRPKGSLNKKTLVKQAEFEEEESEPELDVPAAIPELDVPAAIPERAPESDSEEAEPLQEEREESPKKKAAPLKKRPRVQRAPQVSEPPMSYMQVLQRGLAAARTAQKLERVHRYDAYFSHL
jgi:hypothetical protein